MALAIDTNCILRWLLQDNAEQARIVEDTLNTSPGKVHVADVAIFEAAWVLSSVYGFSDKQVAELLMGFIMHPKINCNRKVFERSLAELPKSPKVSLVDICLVNYASLSDAEALMTFDKKLAKRFPESTLLVE